MKDLPLESECLSVFPERNEYEVHQEPLVQTFDLKTSAQRLECHRYFTCIREMRMDIKFTDHLFDWELFGKDAALTNGVSFEYSGQNFLGTVRSNDDLNFFDSVRITNDTSNPVVRHLTANFDIGSSCPDGLAIDLSRRFFVVLDDDLSGSANDSIKVTIKGYRSFAIDPQAYPPLLSGRAITFNAL